MFIELKRLTWILMLLFLSDVLCDTWKVEYQHICAVKGSSMVILCSYPPNNLTAKNISWAHTNSKGSFSGIDFRKVSSKFQYIGDRLSNCSMRIRQVEKTDARTYVVGFMMWKKHRIIPFKRLVLKVVDLKILVTKLKGSRETLEGDSVNLTCMNNCDARNSSSNFTWFKNGEILSEGPMLYLSSISVNDSGNYTCSLKTQPGTSSGAVNINVEYGPKNTSVSVTPLMGNYTGMNFTLTCSSDAIPPVENYTWFKKDKHDDIAVGHHSVLSTDEAGQYFCSAANKHGSQSSSVVTVGVKPIWTTYTTTVIIIIIAVLLIVVTAIVIKRFCIKSTWLPTTSNIEETEVEDTDYVNWFPCDTIQSQGDNHHEEGTELIYATIDFSNYNNNHCLSKK